MIDRLRELLRADVIDLFRDGSVTFSRERMEWAARGKNTGLRRRLVNEKAPNGGLHARLASPVEDELLDIVAELLDAHDRMAGALSELLAHHDETMNGRCQIADRFRALAVPKEENPDV